LVVETAPVRLARAEESTPVKKKRKPAAPVAQTSPPPASLTPPPQNAAPPVPAETPDVYYAHKRGVIALNTGHYAEAVKAFEEAYALNQDPSLLFNLAQAYRLANQPSKALEACSSFLRSANATSADRAQVERFMAELEMITYQIRMQRDVHQLPAPASAPIEPPPVAAATPQLDLTPQPPPPTSVSLTVVEETSPPKPFYLRPVYWAAAAGVVAAGAVMVWYFIRPSHLRAPTTTLGYQQAFP
jgi:hypothetical protein